MIEPAADGAEATAFLLTGVDWWRLVRFGPPGFEVYLRIAFTDEEDGVDSVRAALTTLARHTPTPTGFVAIWEGWGGRSPDPVAPRIAIPNREMLLFTGPIEEFRKAPSLAWEGVELDWTPPHLAWPEDRSWCLACEVDEEIEFTVGCGESAARELERSLGGLVRRVTYGQDLPLYRDDE